MIYVKSLEKEEAVVFKDQIGGTHYINLQIQPIEYILKNKIPFSEGCVIKYVTRWREKGGIEDLKKAIQTLQQLVEFEEKKVIKNKEFIERLLTLPPRIPVSYLG